MAEWECAGTKWENEAAKLEYYGSKLDNSGGVGTDHSVVGLEETAAGTSVAVVRQNCSVVGLHSRFVSALRLLPAFLRERSITAGRSRMLPHFRSKREKTKPHSLPYARSNDMHKRKM
ncbi:hypothetical protein C6I21_04505 [Alkalicoccus urumqiensis]|uniref:Uncharacterized protein n=1 Tax=Alkalicoccus urumqiensis TaxID=1548213 RepID=A0A2P6MJZ5_ALKUR|nr:hypothetical protein C6I21_04505 [Alkalicoccus urumqiensis]